MEGVTILPIVVPPIVIAAGLAQLQGSAPSWMVSLWFNHPLTGLTPIYVILAMPFTYRAIDTGVRAIDLRTLVDASRSLGASWFSTLARVILPNVETAVLGAIFLTVALCMGEVVIATILLYVTLPVQLIAVRRVESGSLGRALGAEPAVRLPAAVHAFVPRRAQARLEFGPGDLMIRFEGVQRHFGDGCRACGPRPGDRRTAS